MNSGRFPSSKKRLGKIHFTTHTPSLTPARPKIRLARTEPTKPAGAGVVVRVLKFPSLRGELPLPKTPRTCNTIKAQDDRTQLIKQ
ncbi:hypothetical protein AVEN_229291-1 [Araneus ventricosus]|uniref:Uncharacterized protein n=1 Tax=Araneus ventricosus TaxID=182803 RepID=A0A4Y2TEQ4_ARAVE|nr:hypothetical protein AVEN_229291-1 [Araneus ventricosus]